MLLSGKASFNSYGYQLFNFTTNSTGTCLSGIYTIVTDETRHQVSTRRASAWLWHAHSITGNSVPQLNPPFRDRRPGRPQQCWYVDSVGSFARASARAALVSSSRQSFARQADPLHSLIAPDPPS